MPYACKTTLENKLRSPRFSTCRVRGLERSLNLILFFSSRRQTTSRQYREYGGAYRASVAQSWTVQSGDRFPADRAGQIAKCRPVSRPSCQPWS